MSQLYGREYKFTIGPLDVSALRVSFKVEKTLKKQVNTCDLQIWNLNESSRKTLTEPKSLPVLIQAGYSGEMSQIYLGEVRSAFTEIQGADSVTSLSTGDSDRALQSARIAVPIGAKTPNDVALLAICRELGIKLGNATAAAAKLARTGKSMFPVATVLTGSAADRLSNFCHSAGLEWSIQDGKIQILDLNKSLDEKPYILDANSGLIGSPSVSYEKKSKKQIVQAEVLMIPLLRPGLQVIFDSRFVQGLFRITKATYSGDTHGADWKIILECESLK